MGTETVLAAAAACGVEVFVNISTDKAANPISVLGSRGSVLTALSAQAAAGGPSAWSPTASCLP